MKIEPLSILLLTSLMLACGGGGGGTGGGDNIPTGPADVPWTDGAWTQPVPAWGSSTRLTIPYPLTALSLPDLGAFGAHEGGHPELVRAVQHRRKRPARRHDSGMEPPGIPHGDIRQCGPLL